MQAKRKCSGVNACRGDFCANVQLANNEGWMHGAHAVVLQD